MNTAICPAVSASAPNANNTNSAKGSAEFSSPTTAMLRQCWRNAAVSPRHNSMGSKTRLAPPTPTKTSAKGPNSAAPARMNRNDVPQTAASSSNSKRSRRAMFTLRRSCGGIHGLPRTPL